MIVVPQHLFRYRSLLGNGNWSRSYSLCVVEIFMMRKYYGRQHDHDELIIVWAIHVHIIWFICAYDHQPVIVFDHRETSHGTYFHLVMVTIMVFWRAWANN